MKTPSQPTPGSDNAKVSMKGIRGAAMTFRDNPFLRDPACCHDYIDDALIVIADGKILDYGPASEVSPRHPGLKDIEEHKDAIMMPGFVDCHAHYVQSPMVGSYGDTLLSWLNRYTFPTESKFWSYDFAVETAKVYFRQILSQGTTTANVFCTTFGESVNAFFEESERYGTLMISGKVLQDRNVPDRLRDRSAEESVELARELLRKWHGRGRNRYAVIPRFAPTSTPRQLELAGQLYQEYADRGVYLHTHLGEELDEIVWVKELFPWAATYTDIYERYGLLGSRSIFAHCCIMEEVEWEKLHAADCSAVHCPSSNLFLGDGQFRFWEAADPKRPVRLGLGTDIGAGTNFSVIRQAGEAYKVGMLHKHSLDAVRCLYLATLGGATALHLEDRIGTLRAGNDADIAVLDLRPTEFAAWRMGHCETVEEKLFVLMTLGLDNMVRATYVAGRKVYDSEEGILIS